MILRSSDQTHFEGALLFRDLEFFTISLVNIKLLSFPEYSAKILFRLLYCLLSKTEPALCSMLTAESTYIGPVLFW